MQAKLQQLDQYLHQAIGVELEPAPWQDAKRLPAFLRQRYDFWIARLLGQPCLLMVDGAGPEPAAAVVRKHVEQVRAKWPNDVVYVRGRLTAYNRKRLVEQKVPFVVPGNQMYLPTLGVDFREHFRKLIEVPETLSPAAQVLLLHWLLGKCGEPITPTGMAGQLGYSPMTMGRAFNELVAAELGEARREGKERRLRFAGAKAEVWGKAQRFLKSPVTKSLCVREPRPAPDGMQAGLAALAHYTMLAPPDHPVIALHGQEWRSLPLWHNKAPIPCQDPDALEIEIWSYDPRLLAGKDVVDELSLYLSLKDNVNERIQAALEDLIRRLQW